MKNKFQRNCAKLKLWKLCFQKCRSARASTPIAIGGYKNSFETEIALFRRSFGSEIFDTKIEAGGGVLLGEQLLLRVAVKQGDGSNQKFSQTKIFYFAISVCKFCSNL